MSYFVSQDLENASGPRVHIHSCGSYVRRKRGAKTMRWHGPFATDTMALKFAKGIARGSKAAAPHSCVVGAARAVAAPAVRRPRVSPKRNAPVATLHGDDWLAASDPWVPGTPATFATWGEKPWRLELERHLAGVQVPGGETGLVFEFDVATMTPGGIPRDLDNLCEPVFSVVVNRLAWLGGSRTRIEWWSASVRIGVPTGLRLQLGSERLIRTPKTPPLFEFAFEGPLPISGTDPAIPNALRSLINSPLPAGDLEVRLSFGSSALNIGDIATGRVKNVIDCLFPVWGGVAGKPADHRIKRLHVAKGNREAPGKGFTLAVWGM